MGNLASWRHLLAEGSKKLSVRVENLASRRHRASLAEGGEEGDRKTGSRSAAGENSENECGEPVRHRGLRGGRSSRTSCSPCAQPPCAVLVGGSLVGSDADDRSSPRGSGERSAKPDLPSCGRSGLVWGISWRDVQGMSRWRRSSRAASSPHGRMVSTPTKPRALQPCR